MRVPSITVLRHVNRGHSTVYHLGRTESICSRFDDEVVEISLSEALAEPRRLCADCGSQLSKWNAAISSIAAQTHLKHPER